MIDEPPEHSDPDDNDHIDGAIPSSHFWINQSPAHASSSTAQSRPVTDMDFKKLQSKHRRQRKRAQVQQANGTPGLKQIHVKRQAEAMARAIQVQANVEGLEHSQPAWIGSRGAETMYEAGMAGRVYTADEIFELTGERDLRYINWDGM